jgi:hypothetical protein
MNIKFILKFKNGLQATLGPYDPYSLNGDGDLFRLIIKGKLDSQDIMLDGKKFSYSDLQSFEVLFVE